MRELRRVAPGSRGRFSSHARIATDSRGERRGIAERAEHGLRSRRSCRRTTARTRMTRILRKRPDLLRVGGEISPPGHQRLFIVWMERGSAPVQEVDPESGLPRTPGSSAVSASISCTHAATHALTCSRLLASRIAADDRHPRTGWKRRRGGSPLERPLLRARGRDARHEQHRDRRHAHARHATRVRVLRCARLTSPSSWSSPSPSPSASFSDRRPDSRT
jgi:hypothetical protein